MGFNDSGVWIAAILCYVIAIYAFTNRKPVNFWAGHKIQSKKIKNVKLYNFFNGLMWLFLGVYFTVGSYYAYVNDDVVYVIYQIFIKYILLIMIIYYSIIWYCFKGK